MNYSRESGRHGLRSGVPCVKHRCVKCCIETSMPLSPLDLKRILKLGYRLDDFAAETAKGWRLKNRSGRCIFLSAIGCGIYLSRPEGCQLYPLVFDEDLRELVLDDLCPFSYEFEVRKCDVRRLKSLLKRLEREKRPEGEEQ